MNTLLIDLRYGLRTFREAPGFTLTALVTLALGIGANTTIFTAINGLLLRTLPVDHPETLVPFQTLPIPRSADGTEGRIELRQGFRRINLGASGPNDPVGA